jgi:hypothetical protein
LYKLGLVHKREEYFKREINLELEEKIAKNMQQIRLSFRELNEFISGFHSEFVEFGTQHKKQKVETVS